MFRPLPSPLKLIQVDQFTTSKCVESAPSRSLTLACFLPRRIVGVSDVGQRCEPPARLFPHAELAISLGGLENGHTPLEPSAARPTLEFQKHLIDELRYPSRDWNVITPDSLTVGPRCCSRACHQVLELDAAGDRRGAAVQEIPATGTAIPQCDARPDGGFTGVRRAALSRCFQWPRMVPACQRLVFARTIPGPTRHDRRRDAKAPIGLAWPRSPLPAGLDRPSSNMALSFGKFTGSLSHGVDRLPTLDGFHPRMLVTKITDRFGRVVTEPSFRMSSRGSPGQYSNEIDWGPDGALSVYRLLDMARRSNPYEALSRGNRSTERYRRPT